MIFCSLSYLYLGSAAAACVQQGHNCIAANDEQKLRMIRRRITEGEKSRKQSIYVKDADGNLPDSEEVSNN